MNAEINFAPTLEEKEWMYKFYLLAFDSPFNITKKRHIMTSVLSHDKWGWRVVGITRQAILKIQKNDYKLPLGLHRDHLMRSRAETLNTLFKDRHDLDSWWYQIWENDETILMTKEQHDKHNLLDREEIIDVDFRLGYFVNSVVGIKFSRRRDGMFVKDLYENNFLG